VRESVDLITAQLCIPFEQFHFRTIGIFICVVFERRVKRAYCLTYRAIIQIECLKDKNGRADGEDVEDGHACGEGNNPQKTFEVFLLVVAQTHVLIKAELRSKGEGGGFREGQWPEGEIERNAAE
jgi:hypothetical protein